MSKSGSGPRFHSIASFIAWNLRRPTDHTSARSIRPIFASDQGNPFLSHLLWIVLIAILAVASVGARADGGKRLRLFLIVTDGLTLKDLEIGRHTYPHLEFLTEHGTLGLMNCAVSGAKSDTNALLAVATGQQATGETTDEQAANDWEKAPGETVSAAETHRAHLQPMSFPKYVFDAQHSVKHLGIKKLEVRRLNDFRLGTVLANASPSVRTWIVGNADTAGWRRRAALLTVDKLGIGSGLVALRSYDPRLPYGLTDSPLALVDYALQADAEFVVIQLGNGARAESGRKNLSQSEYREAHRHSVQDLELLLSLLRKKLRSTTDDILVISPRPPAADAAHPDLWNELTAILGYGPDFPPGTFTSSTTRTPSLIANTDIAPTILSLFHLSVPAAMTGRPVRVIHDRSNDTKGANRTARVARLNFIAWANSAALAPVLAVLGAFCFISCMLGVIALRFGARKMSSIFAGCAVIAMNFPAAQLFAPILVPPTLLQYGLRIAAWMVALALVSFLLARSFRISAPVAACALNLIAVLIDLVTGQHLLKDALISNYYLAGFRYYGLGNDYLGLMLGFAIAGAFSMVDDVEHRNRKESQPPPSTKTNTAIAVTPELPPGPADPTPNSPDANPPSRVSRGLLAQILIGWVTFAVILGWPTFGANSGSIIVTSAAFGVGWRVLRGGSISWWYAFAFTILGIIISFGFAFLDARLHGDQTAHAGAAIRAASSGLGANYLWEIVVRKVRFNLSLLSLPWTWVTASLVGGALILAPMIADKEIEETKLRRPRLAQSTSVVVVAALVSLVFKDSGVVTVCYLSGSFLLVGLYYLLVPTPIAAPDLAAERN